jgi:protein gp37
MATTKIQWSRVVWNPVTGCTRFSAGCANCYAKQYALRLRGMGKPKYANGFELTLHPDLLEKPFQWKKPRLIFVNSMSDLFHEAVPVDFIRRVFEVMVQTPQHHYQVLTKRSERLLELSPTLPWAQNIWMGVTVEHQEYLHRVDHLRATGAALKFLSLEPLLSPLSDLNLTGIDWVIVGGESGQRARPMRKEWVVEIRDKCLEASVPFFFKQWSRANPEEDGCLLDGREWKDMPRVQEEQRRLFV